MSDDRYRPAIDDVNPKRCEGGVRSWEVQDRNGNKIEVADYTRYDSVFEVFGASSKGPRREKDEDYITAARLNVPGINESIFVLCDGMGGYDGGEAASKLVAESLVSNYSGIRGQGIDGRMFGPQETLRFVAESASAELQREQSIAEAQGGTTAVVCILNESNGDYVIMNVGDSSASLVTTSANTRLTSRHENAKGILLNAFKADYDALLFEDRLERYGKADGLIEAPKVFHRGRLMSGEALVLSCDGLDRVMDSFPEALKGGIAADGTNPASRIVARANEVDGHDNSSAVVITFKNKQAERSGSSSPFEDFKLGLRGRSRQPQSEAVQVVSRPARDVADPAEILRSEVVFGAARTPEELWEIIGRQGSLLDHTEKRLYTASDLYSMAEGVLKGEKPVSSAVPVEGFRDAIERIGCRFYTSNMIKAGHKLVFQGAGLKWGEEQVLYDMIDSIGGLQGTSRYYYAQDLKARFAYEALKGSSDPKNNEALRQSTKTQGFRRALGDMIEDKERNERKR